MDRKNQGLWPLCFAHHTDSQKAQVGFPESEPPAWTSAIVFGLSPPSCQRQNARSAGSLQGSLSNSETLAVVVMQSSGGANDELGLCRG